MRPYRGAIIIAPPGIFGAWAVQLTNEAAAKCQPPLQVRYLGHQDDVDLSDAPQCIFLTEYCSASVLDVIKSGSLPILAFIDEAADAVAFLMRAMGRQFLEALRATTCAAAINPQLADGVSVRVVRRSASVSAARAIDGTVDHLALPMSAEAMLELKQQFAASDPRPESLDASCFRRVEGAVPPAGPPSELSEDQVRTVEAALAPLIAMSGGQREASITWPSGVFLSGDRPDETAPLVADMTGAARVIYYGPYLYLPRGEWKAEITVGFSKEAVGTQFTIEVWGTEMLARARFEAKETGLFSGAFRISHHKHQDHLEFRVRSDQGSIEGRFGLAWVKFSASERPPDHSVE